MNYAIILAGGMGLRMGYGGTPKQFIELYGIPIIIRTLQRLLTVERFDFIYIAIHPDWDAYLHEILHKYSISTEKIRFSLGGGERLDTIENALETIMAEHTVSAHDIVVIHDAVRPFVSKRMLTQSIEGAAKYGAVVAAVAVKDTMLVSGTDRSIAAIPDRNALFHGQAPDSFRFMLLYDALKKLTPEERTKITGTAQICYLKNIPVKLIEGDEQNIKITTPMDIFIARAILFEEDLTK